MSGIKAEDYIKQPELALRWRVTTRTIQNWITAKKIPQPKIFSHKCVAWKREDILAYEKKNEDFLTYLMLK